MCPYIYNVGKKLHVKNKQDFRKGGGTLCFICGCSREHMIIKWYIFIKLFRVPRRLLKLLIFLGHIQPALSYVAHNVSLPSDFSRGLFQKDWNLYLSSSHTLAHTVNKAFSFHFSTHTHGNHRYRICKNVNKLLWYLLSFIPILLLSFCLLKNHDMTFSNSIISWLATLF